MKPIYTISIFAIVVLAQIYVPAKMILDQETILNKGTAYKFKTRPVDPSDPFKGKYIHLNFDINSVSSDDSTWTRYEPIYINLKQDSLGFAMVNSVSRDLPKSGDYVEAKVDWYNTYDKKINFSFPFDEFYMNETKAYDAEVAHIQAQQDSLANSTYALVYILNGKGVLNNVFINDIPIAKYVEKQ